MWIISLIGQWAWPALRFVAPAIGPRVTIALICAAILAFSHGAVAIWVHLHGYRARVEAVAAAKAAFINSLAEEKARHDREIDAARAAAEAVAPVPAARADRLRVCAASPTCRERRG